MSMFEILALFALQSFREAVPGNTHAETAGCDPYHIPQHVLDRIDAALASYAIGKAQVKPEVER